MSLFETIRCIAGVACIVIGVSAFVIEMIGVFKMKYVLNRMHAAAIGDTLGIGMTLLGLMILNGFNFTTLKFLLVIVFLWLTSPVSSHLIANLELTINEEEGHYEEVQEQ